jgi:hypothetical protein
MGRGIVAAPAAVFRCAAPPENALVYRSGGDDSLARRYTHSTSSAHSSSGLGHRPLTAAARVRIPYGPFCCAWLRANRMVARVRRVRGAGNVHAVPTWVLPRDVVYLDAMFNLSA